MHEPKFMWCHNTTNTGFEELDLLTDRVHVIFLDLSLALLSLLSGMNSYLHLSYV